MRVTHLAVFSCDFSFIDFVKESGKQFFLKYNSHAKRSKTVKEILKNPFQSQAKFYG